MLYFSFYKLIIFKRDGVIEEGMNWVWSSMIQCSGDLREEGEVFLGKESKDRHVDASAIQRL